MFCPLQHPTFWSPSANVAAPGQSSRVGEGPCLLSYSCGSPTISGGTVCRPQRQTGMERNKVPASDTPKPLPSTCSSSFQLFHSLDEWLLPRSTFLRLQYISGFNLVSLDMDVNIFLSVGKQIKPERIAWNYRNSEGIPPPIPSAN